jgi:hypothetical protein
VFSLVPTPQFLLPVSSSYTGQIDPVPNAPEETFGLSSLFILKNLHSRRHRAKFFWHSFKEHNLETAGLYCRVAREPALNESPTATLD